VPNRHGSSTAYRYGFNGMELDNELKGEGNSINYEARMLDTRVGRFLSRDPLASQFPHYSPYQFAGNTPIQAIDLDGAEEYDYRLIVKNGIAQLKLTNVKNFNHHSWFGGLIEFDTKITAKRYIVHYDNKTYHIGFAQYGVGYSNAWMTDDFENNYVKNKNNVDEVSFESNYTDDNISKSVSNVNIVVQTQNASAEASISMGDLLVVNPKKIRFSQNSINGLKDLESSMETNGWKGLPIDVVKMEDGKLTTVDNTRVTAAQNTKTTVTAKQHNYSDPISEDMAPRFADKKGKLPTTWGQAIKNRVNSQSGGFGKQNPNGSYKQPKSGN
jgi:RHS repeat-associated protein